MGNQDAVAIEYVLKPSDVYTPWKWARWNVFIWVTVFLIWIAVYDLCFSATAFLKTVPEGSSISSVVELGALLISFGFLVLPYLRVLAMFRNSPALRKSRRLTFSNAGIHLDSEDVQADYKWSLFVQVAETNDLIVLLMTTHAATYVPKRDFRSHDDIETVRKLIRENFKGKWRLRRD